MKSYVVYCAVLAAVAFLAVADAMAAQSAIVYDNSDLQSATSGQWTPGGFLPFNFYNANEPMGDEITLAGTEREITYFDLLLSSSAPTVLSSLTLTLRKNDGIIEWMGNYPYGPGTLLWSSTIYDVQVDGLTTISFSLPQVVVPDTFTWLASSNSTTAGLATFDPPTVGTSEGFYWDYDVNDGNWYQLGLLGQSGNFGATVLAVPEPTCLVLLSAGGLALLRRRR